MESVELQNKLRQDGVRKAIVRMERAVEPNLDPTMTLSASANSMKLKRYQMK